MTGGGRPLGDRELDAAPFPGSQCDALFANVLVNDKIDDDARLPPAIRFDYTSGELTDCFRLCRQLWYSGFDRDVLVGLAATLVRDRDLDEPDRVRFKHIRAKFKHFRFAHSLYGTAHVYPPMLDRVTITMGHLQDAYRNGRRGVVLREAWLLRLLLSRLPLRRLRHEADHILLTTPAAFRALLEDDVAALAAMISGDTITGHRFHASRKVVSRQISFWDTLRTIEPSEERYDMSRSLAAINSLMGGLHDRLVERRAEDPDSYHRDFVLPDDIRIRIAALVGAYERNLRVPAG